MLKIWNGTTAEYLALAEKDLNTVYNVTDEVTADSSKISGFNLFDFKWSDHIINNISWTRADNFSWHSATVYVSAYNKLLKEKERASTVLETETIDDITISFYRSENNYKICLPDQLANLTSLYEKTGVAWYYVIDTENKQFKLPRTKWGFTGLRNKAGDYVSESVPNITGAIQYVAYTSVPTGAFKLETPLTVAGPSSWITTDSGGRTTSFNASRSSSAYQDGASVQERATEMYLYFYVGNTLAVESEVNLDTLVTNVEKLKKDSGGSLEIGDIGFAPLGIDETENKRRYLNGQVISQSQFVSFTNKIKSAIELYPNLATSETNWQAEVTNSKLGQCGKFVIDDTTGTIRLPKVVNINGLQDLALMGSIKAESLPDHWHVQGLSFPQSSAGVSKYGVADGKAQSTVWDSGSNTTTTDGIKTSPASLYFGNTYQDNAPVQQEAVQYPYFIQVATGVEESVDVTREIELNNPFSLLDYKWSEYELNNASWLLSNGQFNSGATYSAVYELLLKIHNGTETKDGVSVKLSTEAYTDTDFVINTADTTFRLPIKVKLASGNRVAGNGMSLGFEGKNKYTGGLNGYTFNDSNPIIYSAAGAYGAYVGDAVSNYAVPQANTAIGITTDPTKSGIETSSSGLKLYFYVGETIQDANVIAASQVLTKVANGIDRTVATDRETVVGWGMPDYSAGVSKAWNTNITAENSGVVIANAVADQSTTLKAIVNGNQLPYNEIANYGQLSINFGVFKGDVYKVYGANGNGTIVFYPLTGVN